MKNTDLGIFYFGIVLFVTLIMLLNNVHMSKLTNTKSGVVTTIGIAMGFVVLPLLPFAISVRYQSSVNASD